MPWHHRTIYRVRTFTPKSYMSSSTSISSDSSSSSQPSALPLTCWNSKASEKCLHEKYWQRTLFILLWLPAVRHTLTHTHTQPATPHTHAEFCVETTRKKWRIVFLRWRSSIVRVCVCGASLHQQIFFFSHCFSAVTSSGDANFPSLYQFFLRESANKSTHQVWSRHFYPYQPLVTRRCCIIAQQQRTSMFATLAEISCTWTLNMERNRTANCQHLQPHNTIRCQNWRGLHFVFFTLLSRIFYHYKNQLHSGMCS